MSLSSSIEFQSSTAHFVRRDSGGDWFSSAERGGRKMEPRRVCYPAGDGETIDNNGADVVKPFDHGIRIVNLNGDDPNVPDDYLHPQMVPVSSPSVLKPAVPSSPLAVESHDAMNTTLPPMPFPLQWSSSVDARNSISSNVSGDHEKNIDGGDNAANGEGSAIDGEETVNEIKEEEEEPLPVIPNEVDETFDSRGTDRFGFIGGSGREVVIPVKVFRQRENKWLEMLDNWQVYMIKRFDKVKSRCRKGIPSSLRPRAWKYLCGAQFFTTSSKTKNIFETLDKHPGDPHWNSEIVKDLNRQFPNHEMFSQATPYGKFGQEDLFRVLKAWTLLHPEEGYCQAQAPIAAALLMHMPVHEAFYCFAQICQKYLPGYFSAGLEAIQLDGDILFGLLKKHSYSSYKHLKKQNIDPVLYMVEWFMCIFCRTLPWPCVLRVLDMFFCEGVKVLFKVGVFLFKYGLSSREQLQSCPSIYDTIERLRHLPIENLNEEYMVQKVTELNISDEDLERVHFKQMKIRNKKKRTNITM